MSVDFEQKVFPCTFVPYKIPLAISLWTVIPTIEVSSQIRVTDNASGSVLNRSTTNLLYSQSVSSETSAFGILRFGKSTSIISHEPIFGKENV